MIIKATIYDEDTSIVVTGELSPASRGKRDKYGVQMEPDEEASITILDAVDEHGTSRILEEKESDRAKEALWERGGVANNIRS